MLLQEFEERTGYYPSAEEYKVIEEFYMESDFDKDIFCKFYKENTSGLAKEIRDEINKRRYQEVVTAVNEKEKLQVQILQLKEKLEKEQEWIPYELKENVSRAQYNNLKIAHGTEILDENVAKRHLYQLFGFSPEAIKIVMDIPIYEKNRHNLLRTVGVEKRPPLYNSSDWNYIRFDCGQMSWEYFNDQLRPFSR